jgi:hypothetical protein
MGVYELSGAGSVKTGRTVYTSMNAGNQFGAMVPIASVVLTATSPGIQFNNFPTNVQDLRFVISARNTSTNGNMNIYFNGDVGSGNYSTTFLQGDGSSATSSRNSNQNFLTPTLSSVSTDPAGLFTTATVDILNWQSNTFKTLLWRYAGDKNGSGTTRLDTSLWRGTSVSTFSFSPSSNLFDVGSTFTCYGIRAVSS